MIREAEGRLDATPIELDVSGTVAAIQLGHPIHVVVDGAALVRWMRGQIGGWGGSQSVLVLRALTSVLDGTLHAYSPLASALAAGLTDCIGLLTSCELTELRRALLDRVQRCCPGRRSGEPRRHHRRAAGL